MYLSHTEYIEAVALHTFLAEHRLVRMAEIENMLTFQAQFKWYGADV
jgi:hypothetical protein